jgi:hypothetical protein
MILAVLSVGHTAINWVSRMPYLLVVSSTVLVLGYGSMVAKSPSHVGLPIHEIRNSGGCGWLDEFEDVYLPVTYRQTDIDNGPGLEEMADHLRAKIVGAAWFPLGKAEKVLALGANEVLFIRSVANESGRVTIDGEGQAFDAQPWSEVRLVTRTPEHTRTLRVSGEGVQYAIVAADIWTAVGVPEITRGLNGLVDPVYHLLTPCVESVATDSGMFKGFDWTISDPRATDLGQSFPLDIGVRHAAELGLIRLSCPHFSNGLDLGQCFYMYQNSPRLD